MNCKSFHYYSNDIKINEIETPVKSVGRVFNIQRYSLNDGDGIRTVIFFKGCPLKCPWCANPESRSLHKVNVRREAKCLHCNICEEDVEECPSGAFEQVGTDMTIDEIMQDIAKDDVFFRTSGGGVTLSGGEILTQPIFIIALLKRLKKEGYHTAIETSGHGNRVQLLKIAALCDEVLYDFKIMDPIRAKQVIGINITRVLENFTLLVESGVKIIPRLPLIPGFTMDALNIDKVLKFLRPYNLDEIHLLPFHQYGASKYDTFGMEYQLKDIEVPSKCEINSIRDHVESYGYRVTIGG